MAYDGTPPPPGGGLPTSDKAREVLDSLRRFEEGNDKQAHGETLLRALYEPALAVAAAINLVRMGNTGMAPFVGAGGVILSQALAPLVAHFGDGEVTFEQAFERIGIPVVRFSDLPDAPDVETPAADPEEPTE